MKFPQGVTDKIGRAEISVQFDDSSVQREDMVLSAPLGGKVLTALLDFRNSTPVRLPAAQNPASTTGVSSSSMLTGTAIGVLVAYASVGIMLGL